MEWLRDLDEKDRRVGKSDTSPEDRSPGSSGDSLLDDDDFDLDTLLPWDVDASLEELDEYKLTRLLGEGAMGRVFLARDRLLDRKVAIKLIAQPDRYSRERFLVEARAAARVQHPNIISVYRIGQVGDTPYIVSEYVRGKSLSDVDKPMRWQDVLTLAIPLLRGLAAAHRNGVLHRDIKPDNVIVSRAGEPKLGDFGLAKLLDLADTHGSRGLELEDETTSPGPLESSTAGAIVGTPYYMAPEIWRGEAATVRSDLYSFGALLYELCAGVVPHRGVLPRELQQVVGTTDAPALGSRARHVDQRLAALVDRCLARDPEARFESADALLDALLALDTVAKAPPLPDGSPYRGLLPFDFEHRALFFGRDVAIREVIERMRTEPLVLVAGQSGVGKSSLIRAGVLPRIREAGLGNGRVWTSFTLVPGAHPLTVLGTKLSLHAELDAVDDAALAGELFSDIAAASRRLRGRLGQKSGLIIFIDQLEELVTLSEPEQARAACNALAGLIERTPSARFLATVRGDKLVDLAQLPGLGKLVERSLYILRPLGEDEIRQAVVGPALAKDVRFESDALVTRLVQSTVQSTGGLPLLQFALSELWDARDQEQNIIPDHALDRLGGVEGALSRHADSVVDKLLPATRAAARKLMIRLVTVHGTRDRHSEVALVGGDDTRRAALRALIEGRLVVARQVESESTCEIAHEALVTSWTTLRRWLDQEGNQRVVRERLAAAAQEWDRMERGRDALWRGRPLGEASDLDRDDLTAVERAFVAASVREEARGRRLRRGLFTAAFLTLTVVLIVVWYFARRAEHLREEATRERARAERFATESQKRVIELYLDQARQKLRDGDPMQAFVLLAEARNAGADDVATHFLISRAIDSLSGQLLVLPAHGGQVLWAEFSADDRYIATAGADRTARLWEASTGRLLHTFDHEREVFMLAFDPRGAHVATAGFDGVVSVWSTKSGQRVWTARQEEALQSVRYDRQGRRLITASRDHSARIWDAEDGHLLHVLAGHTSTVTLALFSPAGDLAATASADGEARIWDARTGQLVRAITSDLGGITALAISPDGTWIAIGSQQSPLVRLVSLHGGTALTLTGHSRWTNGVAFSPDGQRLVTAGADGVARVWDVQSGKPVLELAGHAGEVTDATFSPDGRSILTASRDGTLRTWDARTGLSVWKFVGHEDAVWRADFDVSGDHIVSAGFDGTARVWNARQAAYRLLLDEHGQGLGSAAFSADGDRIATAQDDGVITVSQTSGDRLLSFNAGSEQANVTWSPDGTRLLVSLGQQWVLRGGRKEASLWDAQSGALLQTIRAASNRIFRAAYDPLGQRIVTAEPGGIATIRDADTGEPVLTLRGHQGDVWSAAFDARGKRVATASQDTTTRIWDATTGALLHTLTGHTLDVISARFSEDGSSIVTAGEDKVARIWTDRGDLVTTLEGHTNMVVDARFSPDGFFIVTASEDGSVRVWDARTGTQLWLIDHHGDAVWSAELSPDGRELLVAAGTRAIAWNIGYKRWRLDELAAFAACRVSYAWKRGRLERIAIDWAKCNAR